MTSTLINALNLDFVRQQFPALAGDWVFMDNAGGSQTLRQVVDRISEYLLTSDVQLGASYDISQLAGARVKQAAEGVAALMNAANPSEVVMGGSTTLLLRLLSLCLGRTLSPGDEIIVTNCDHEANIGCWMDLRRSGIEVKIWQLNPKTLQLELDDLEQLMTSRTRLVAMTHASNILGTINSLRPVADRVHAHNALLCVDGVGYAAHRQMDVQEWDVDFYVFSFYKVYGPHYAALYGKQKHLLALPGINHYFINESSVPYKFQPGNVNFELSSGMLGVVDYLQELANYHPKTASPSPKDSLALRDSLAQAFNLITQQEEQLADRLLSYLTSRPNIRIIGENQSDRHLRVPTISFVVDGTDSATIPPRVDPHKIAIRYGDFYARRLIEDLGLASQSGVVRVSLVHYNTLEEVDRLIEILDRILT